MMMDHDKNPWYGGLEVDIQSITIHVSSSSQLFRHWNRPLDFGIRPESTFTSVLTQYYLFIHFIEWTGPGQHNVKKPHPMRQPDNGFLWNSTIVPANSMLVLLGCAPAGDVHSSIHFIQIRILWSKSTFCPTYVHTKASSFYKYFILYSLYNLWLGLGLEGGTRGGVVVYHSVTFLED